MRILFVCHRFPYPPSRGGKIRPFHLIRHLHRSGHEVTVGAPLQSAEEEVAGRDLSKHCSEILTARVGPVARWLRMLARLPTPLPSSSGNFYAPDLARAIERRLCAGSFDLILVHCSTAAQYVTTGGAAPSLLDFGDMDSQKWRLYAQFQRFPLWLGYAWEGWKLQRYETELARRFDLCTCTTRAELETLRSLKTGTASDWFPNGVDAERFTPSDEPYDPNLICFVGRMDYYPNQLAMLEFCREVWPRVKASRPAVKLEIVGANPPRVIRRLSSLSGVSVTGTVPDTRPYFARAALSVAPLGIARGTQNKILESMAMGVPVVASELAAQGVDAVPGEHLLTASTPAELASSVLRLLEDRSLRQAFASAARARVLSHHDWACSMRKLDGILERVLSQRGRPTCAPGSSH